LDTSRKKANNKQDALISITALDNNYGLITADSHLAEVMTSKGVRVITLT